jgi:predicted kinase
VRRGVVTLYIMIGLPGAGKSSFAKRFLAHAERVSLDEIRSNRLEVRPWNSKIEETVKNTAEDMVLQFLTSGRDVVVDATNLTAFHRQRWIGLAEGLAKVVLVVIETPVDVCIERRAGVIPASRIKEMYSLYQYPESWGGELWVVRSQ